MENKCGLCYMSTIKHCESPTCTWRRCIRCRASGVDGGTYKPYFPALSLEELYAMPGIADDVRNPPRPVFETPTGA